MFISQLSDQEKRSFLNLALAVMNADGVADDKEMALIGAYNNELHLDKSDFDQLVETAMQQDIKVEQHIAVFAQNQFKELKRGVYVELMSLSIADGDYAPSERLIMDKLAEGIGLDQQEKDEAYELAQDYICAINNLVRFVKS